MTLLAELTLTRLLPELAALTLARAKEMLEEAGAAAVLSAVAVVKSHPQPVFKADHALFTAGDEFLFGYGMDREGLGRGAPDIRVKRG